jgi:hypothetical protein
MNGRTRPAIMTPPQPVQQTPRDPTPGVSLHIERLVLEGLPLVGNAGARLQTALSTELSRLLGDAHTDLRHGEALAFLRLDDMALDTGRDPERLGRQLAHALVRGLVPSHQAGSVRSKNHG